MTMQDGNITIANDPFGLFFKFFKIDLINDAAYSITSSRTHHRLYLIIIQHLLQIVQSFFISTGKIIKLVPNGLTHLGSKAPFFI